MPKISVKKDHLRALELVLAGGDKLDKKAWDSLRELRGRIQTAYEDKKEPPRLGVGQLIDIAERHLGPRLGLPPKPQQTEGWFAKMSSLIGAANLDVASAEQLCVYVARWAKKGIALETLLVNATKWLSSAAADEAVKTAEVAEGLVVDRGLFDD